jgi:hypothetical protein
MRRLRPNRAAAVYPVVVTGLLHGLGRAASYAAAASGAWPTLNINGCLVVVAEPINKALGLSGITDERVRLAFTMAGYPDPAAEPSMIGHNGGPPLEATVPSKTHLKSDAEKPPAKLKPARAARSRSARRKSKSKSGANAVRKGEAVNRPADVP